MKRLISMLSTALLSVVAPLASAADTCPDFLNQEFRRLHTTETVNLCSLYNGKPLVIVNTASHCGYTKQFTGLEALYQTYKDEGVEVIGFPSDDFKQAAKSEEEAATVCYENYGVTFTMLSTTSVKGDDANTVFRHLNAETEEPSWNFNKYLVTDNGKSITHFGSKVKPQGSELEEALKQAL